LLDLYCKAGGAARGYHDIGWEVVGVDIEPQPNYPYEFHCADALTFPLDGFDAVHASPPCQGYSKYVSSADSQWVTTRGKNEPRLIAPTRERIKHLPYIIENVYSARDELEFPVLLCGVMFGLPIARHRLFESNVPLAPPPHPKCKGAARRYSELHGIEYRDMSVTGKGRHTGTSDRWREFLGVTWPTTQAELVEMIPPAYTQWIGHQLLAALEVVALSNG
jgi:DNA (cytosine-5)-methyltransferase 1